MQEKSMNDLMGSVFDKKLDTPKKVKEKMKKIAKENTKAIADMQSINPLRTPTEEELGEIREFMIEYKKAHPKASKREIRKAAQEKFHIRILRKPFKREKNAIQS